MNLWSSRIDRSEALDLAHIPANLAQALAHRLSNGLTTGEAKTAIKGEVRSGPMTLEPVPCCRKRIE